MPEAKRKKVVICGANGEIGKETAKELARMINDDGLKLDICLVTRAKDDRKGDFAKGLSAEILDSLVTDAGQHTNADLLRAFRPENHAVFNPNDLSSLENTLKDADVVIVTAGVPRKGNQERAELISSNADAVIPYTKAVARYAPLATPIVSVPNPLDNVVTIQESVCREEWAENPREGKIPDIKVVGMAGPLDETRLKKFVASAINAAFAETGSDEKVFPDQVGGNVFGQHGPTMVIDLKSVMIGTRTFDSFIKARGLEAKRDAIILDFTKKTKGAGKEVIDNFGHSAMYGPGKKAAEMACSLLYADPQEKMFGEAPGDIVTASVVYRHNGTPGVASGRPVSLSRNGIAYAPFPAYSQDDDFQAAMNKSRGEILTDQASYELIKVLKNAAAVTSNGNGDIVTLEMPNIAPDKLNVMAQKLDTWLGGSGTSETSWSQKIANAKLDEQQPKIVINVNSTQLAALANASRMAGKEMISSAVVGK